MSETVASVLKVLLQSKLAEHRDSFEVCRVYSTRVRPALSLRTYIIALHYDGKCYRVLVVDVGSRRLEGIRGLSICPD